MGTPTFVLASASPARRRLLQSVGISPIVQPSHFDEDSIQTTDPATLVQTLAIRKAETVAAQLTQDDAMGAINQMPLVVMGCDSVLALHGKIYGKPDSPEQAIARWQEMRGDVGDLYTGHTLIDLPVGSDPTKARSLVRCRVTRVYFANISDAQIAAYVATGEPMNCAGCFAVEGKGGAFVEKLEGCHTNVIGLSLPLLRQMLGTLGYDITDFWHN